MNASSAPLTCACLALLIAAAGVEAEPLDPAEVAAPYRGRTVASVELTGLPEKLGDGLENGLALSGRSRLIGTERAVLYPNLLAEDTDRIRLYLARRGYPRSTVTPIVKALDDRQVRVVFEIEPGARVGIARIRLVGVPESLSDEARSAFALERGSAFTDAGLEGGVAAVRKLLERNAYPFPDVSPRVTAVGADSVEIRVRATPGPAATFGEVRISGTTDDLVPLVERASGIDTGDPYTPEAISRAQDTYRRLGLFRQIRLEVVRTDRPDVVDVEVSLANRAPRTLEVGGGYWSDESVRGQIRWRHRNLLGGGRGFRTGGLASTLRQQAEAGIWFPAVLDPNVRAEVNGLVEHRNEESYELLLTQGEIALRYQPSFRSSYRTAFLVSQADVEILADEAEFEETRGLVTSLLESYGFEGADDRLNPGRGWVLRASGEITLPRDFSESHFLRLEGSVARYVPLLDATLAGRVRGGWARPLEDSSDLLPNKRFFAGGATSMRGFRRNDLGPTDDEGKAIGGEAKLEASVELRIPVISPFAIAVFTDTGQVWAERGDVALDELEVAVGGGIMLITPIGPIRFDVGHRITDVLPEPRETAYHLSIGHPF